MQQPEPATGQSQTGVPGGQATGPNPDDLKLQQRLQRLRMLGGELLEYASFYLSARADGLKATAKKLGIYAAAGILGLIGLCTTIATAVVLLLCGIGLGLGRLFGDRYWLGFMVIGLVVLGGLAAGAYWGNGKLMGSFRSQTVRKYEQRKERQARRFGRNVQVAANHSRRSGVSG